MAEALQLIFLCWVIAAVGFHLLWKFQRATSDASVVDVAWAGTLGALALTYGLLGDGDVLRRCIVAALGGIWGFRLSFYLLRDRVIGKEEDGRYQALRAHWGERAHFNFIFFFQAQAALAVFLSIPFLIIAFDSRATLSWTVFLGIGIWIISVIGESIADAQLSAFRSNPENKGKTCRDGLWRYSRHPNYFFEWLHWFSYVAIAYGAPYWMLTLIAPIVMYVFITRFTGIPYTEMQALKSRGDDYRRYQESTNALIPWFPKTEGAT